MTTRWNPEKHGDTGKLSELAFIGSVNKSAAYYAALADWARFEAAQKIHGKFEDTPKPDISPENEVNFYLNFNHSLDIVKKFQNGDPVNPHKELARDLRLEVADMLGLTEDEDLERIRFYSSTNTPLDWYHGTDCFVEYIDQNGEMHIFRFDLTKNQKKKEESEQEIFNKKGAMIIADLPDPQEETNAYLEKVQSIAEQVADKFRAEESERVA